MNILVTGSLGTLGKPLAGELRHRGHDVTGCDLRHVADASEVRCDIADFRQIARTIEAAEPDVVYHLAAEFGRHNGEDYFEQLWRSNVIGTRNILELQRAHGFRLVFTSSSEVYGDADADVLDEGVMDREAVRQPNDYAITKWVNELQCMNFMDRFDSDIVRVRLFNGYGPGEHYHDYRSVVALFVYRALHGIPFDVYRGYHRVFMYVDDLIETFAGVHERGESGEVYNIGGREYRGIADLADLVLRETGASKDLIRWREKDEHNRKNKRPDITKAERVLGHDPTVPLEEGVPRTVAWMARRYNVRSEAAA